MAFGLGARQADRQNVQHLHIGAVGIPLLLGRHFPRRPIAHRPDPRPEAAGGECAPRDASAGWRPAGIGQANNGLARHPPTATDQAIDNARAASGR